jgi:sterol desaturase/sphingolipid hydroxylase (fatty acid hydroxylase superfamily)
MFISLATFVLGPILGLDPGAAAVVNLFLTFNAVFQHANIRTPQWLGYIIERPESHSAHHERGVHRYNYSDLPLWDIVFGTFKNPKTFEGEAGFYDGASTRVVDMMLGRDVSRPEAA